MDAAPHGREELDPAPRTMFFRTSVMRRKGATMIMMMLPPEVKTTELVLVSILSSSQLRVSGLVEHRSRNLSLQAQRAMFICSEVVKTTRMMTISEVKTTRIL